MKASMQSPLKPAQQTSLSNIADRMSHVHLQESINHGSPATDEEDPFTEPQSVHLRQIEPKNPGDKEEDEELYEDPLGAGGMDAPEWD